MNIKWKTQYGIYKITNITNENFYIGSSCRLSMRRSQHFKELKENKHCNRHLQNAYNKYGEENFKFEVLEYFKFPINYNLNTIKEHLVTRELFYIQTLQPIFNIVTTDCNYTEKKSYSEETLLKFKENYKNNINFHNAPRNCEKALKGKHRTLEERIKISKGKRNSTRGLYIGMYDINNKLLKRFTMASEAAEFTKIGRNAIANNLAGLSKKCYTPTKQQVIFKKIV